MGLLEIFAARALGAPVIALEPQPARRVLARRAGAEVPESASAAAARGLLGPEGARAVFVTTAAAAAIGAGIELAGPAGVVQLFAPPPPGHPVPVDLGAAWFREVRIESTYSAGPTDTVARCNCCSRARSTLTWSSRTGSRSPRSIRRSGWRAAPRP